MSISNFENIDFLKGLVGDVVDAECDGFCSFLFSLQTPFNQVSYILTSLFYILKVSQLCNKLSFTVQ